MRKVERLLLYTPTERQLRLCAWACMVFLDLAVLVDLLTRMHPSWRFDLSDFVVAMSVTIFSLVTGEFLFTLHIRDRLLGSTPLWVFFHAMALFVWFWLAVPNGVLEAIGAREWWGTENALSYDKDQHVFFDALFVALIVGGARVPFQYAYRRSINSPGNHSLERMLIGVGLNLILLAMIGDRPLFRIPEQYDARPTIAEDVLQSVIFIRDCAWTSVRGLGVFVFFVAIAIVIARLLFVETVRRRRLDRWRIVEEREPSDRPERVFLRVPFRPLSAVLEHRVDARWHPFARLPGRFRAGRQPPPPASATK